MGGDFCESSYSCKLVLSNYEYGIFLIRHSVAVSVVQVFATLANMKYMYYIVVFNARLVLLRDSVPDY